MSKFIFLLLLFVVVVLPAAAQETVLPITVEERENEFYTTQYRLWRAVTEKEPTNAQAWWNLYAAARYRDFPAIFRDTTYKSKVTALVERIGAAIPDTYEFHYIYAWHHGFGQDNLEHLLTAYRIDSSRPKILENLFTHYHAEGDWEMATYYMNKWYRAKELAPQLLHFGYNLLASTEENGILFLSGDNDSYPTWMLQMTQNIRPDVAAINVYLMNDADYARKLLAKYDIQADDSAYAWLGRDRKDIWQNSARFIQHLAEKNPDRKIYLPPTMVREIQEVLEDDLYIVGAVYQYCRRRFDNIAVLKRNWNTRLKLDYLDFLAYGDGYHYTPAGLPYTVYIYYYPALALYKHYRAAGEGQKAAEVMEFCEKISNSLGKPNLHEDFIKEMQQ
ncbi:MAG: hypothetical protein AAF998_27460 [Bacteroidota bacterium]